MSIINLIISALYTGGSIGYLILNILKMDKVINPWSNLITSIILVVISLIFLILTIIKKNEGKIFIIINSIVLVLVTISLLIELNVFKLPQKQIIGNLNNKPITEVMKMGKDNNITINYSTEYSDNIPTNYVISQDIDPNTLLSQIKTINLIVSSGPNYDKDVVIPNMIGWTSDKVLEYINKNHLNNVNVNFITSEYDKNTVIEQSLKGNAKRNSSISLTLSYGLNEPSETTLIDLSNKNRFEIEFYLKMNAIYKKIIL